jgi:hypothetical protein
MPGAPEYALPQVVIDGIAGGPPPAPEMDPRVAQQMLEDHLHSKFGASPDLARRWAANIIKHADSPDRPLLAESRAVAAMRPTPVAMRPTSIEVPMQVPGFTPQSNRPSFTAEDGAALTTNVPPPAVAAVGYRAPSASDPHAGPGPDATPSYAAVMAPAWIADEAARKVQFDALPPDVQDRANALRVGNRAERLDAEVNAAGAAGHHRHQLDVLATRGPPIPFPGSPSGSSEMITSQPVPAPIDNPWLSPVVASAMQNGFTRPGGGT